MMERLDVVAATLNWKLKVKKLLPSWMM